jgi:hypothetical protein
MQVPAVSSAVFTLRRFRASRNYPGWLFSFLNRHRRRNAYDCKVKFTVTVMMTGTGTPFSSVGVYSHCFTASNAA